LRIVHIQDYFVPVLGYQEAFLPREQAKLGHEVSVVACDRYLDRIYSANKSLLGENRIIGTGFFVEEGINVWRLKTLFERPPNIVWVHGLEEKVSELEPDIVIMHSIISLSAIRIAWLKKRRGNFKLIYDDHMAFGASQSKLRVLYPVFKWTFSYLIQKNADALVGVADTSKAFMNKKYGIPLERIAVVPLGADDELFKFSTSDRREIRDRLSLEESNTVFIYAGKIIPEKAPHLLIEAAIRLMYNHDNVRVVLVGNGPETYIEKMRDAVPNKSLPKFYSAADVAVWPCECSLSMMEAMACSLPVIISDASETTERVSYNNGLTYHGDDILSLSQQMEKLLDPKLRREMGANGRKLIEEKLNWRTIARQFIELAEHNTAG